MRKFMMIMMSAALLCGCASRNKEASSAKPVKTAEPERETVWEVKPTLEYDSVTEMNPEDHYFVKVTTQDYGDLYVKTEPEWNGYPAEVCGYSGDAVITEKDNEQFLVNYEGKELSDVSISLFNTPRQEGITGGIYNDAMAFGYQDNSSSKAIVFSKNFKSTTETDSDSFKDDPNDSSNAEPFFAYLNDTFGVVVMTTDDAGNRRGWTFEELDPSILSGRIILDIVNNAYASQSKAVYDPATNTVIPLASGNYHEGSFANGDYVVDDGNNVTVIDADSGQGIAVSYQDAKYFEDDYAPVKKYGKWGYIDSTGKEVTDFIFDDASVLYKGKGFVKWHGKYGVIDISNTLKSGEQVNINTIDTAIKDKEMGNITVNVSDLVIRSDASVNSDTLGISASGTEYPYYETKDADGYTWYRIATDAWIADNGSWLTKE